MANSTEAIDPNKQAESPLVFISHDTRDGDLAEAFSKLLKAVSAGMLKSFRSSDKSGVEGIEFGDEWYKTLMGKLAVASDVVCILTERSLDRPWILYEAGVAKGKLDTPVHGLALGVPLSRVSTGPFYQFQNSDDGEQSLSKLVLQLCRRIPGLEPDTEVVLAQVKAFKSGVDAILAKLGGTKKPEKVEAADETAIAKVLEEMKLLVRELPQRFEQRVIEVPDRIRFKRRRIHPAIIDEFIHRISRRRVDPVGILIISSFLRDDFPWLYEIGLEAYRIAKNKNPAATHKALRSFRDAADLTFHSHILDEMGFNTKEMASGFREFPMLIDHYLNRLVDYQTERAKVREKNEPIDEESGPL